MSIGFHPDLDGYDAELAKRAAKMMFFAGAELVYYGRPWRIGRDTYWLKNPVKYCSDHDKFEQYYQDVMEWLKKTPKHERDW